MHLADRPDGAGRAAARLPGCNAAKGARRLKQMGDAFIAPFFPLFGFEVHCATLFSQAPKGRSISNNIGQLDIDSGDSHGCAIIITGRASRKSDR
jgi:hypothetical protein